MDVEETEVLDCFVQAGAELQHTQVAPEADAFTYAQIAGHEGVTVRDADLGKAKATDVLAVPHLQQLAGQIGLKLEFRHHTLELGWVVRQPVHRPHAHPLARPDVVHLREPISRILTVVAPGFCPHPAGDV